MSTELAIRPEQLGFDDAQRAALEALGVTEAPDGDVKLLFHLAQRSGLDPFARQIYLIPRWDGRTQKQKWTIQTGIDGLRVLRDRLGSYRGHTTEWCGPNGIWRDVWLDARPPAAARVSVYVAGRQVPAVGIALWSEYVQTTKTGEAQALWKSKGTVMLAKCAEAIAYRQAFPTDFSGLYTTEEMPPGEETTIPELPARETAAEIAAKLAGRAAFAETAPELRDLYREARQRAVLDIAVPDGSTLGEYLQERGERLATEEELAASGEPEHSPMALRAVDPLPEPVDRDPAVDDEGYNRWLEEQGPQ